MKRSIWFWLYFVIAIILAIYISVRVTMTAMGHGATSRISGISISSNTRDHDLTAIATAAAVPAGSRIFSTNLDTINARVKSVPGVRDVAVRRRPDGKLNIRVELYRAVALWWDGNNYFPLSADGTIVQRPTDVRDIGAVVFRGPVPNDITNITKAAHNMGTRLDYMEWIENRRWNMHTTGGITVMLPEQSPESAIAGLIALDENHHILNKDITAIDMRDNARILVTK